MTIPVCTKLEKCWACVFNNTVLTVLPYVHESLVTKVTFLHIQVLYITTLCSNGLDSYVCDSFTAPHAKFLQLRTMNADNVQTIICDVTLASIKGSQFQTILNYVSYANI